MGQSYSFESRLKGASYANDRKKTFGLRERLQLLEDLVQGQFKQRRQELLLQLSSSDDSQRVGHSILPKAPEEFKLGSLIAAGSYGRVYAGTYRGQPAALKLLILDEESAAAILNEVRLCLKLNHRNLVRLLDCAVVGTSTRSFVTGSDLDGTSGNWMRSDGQQGYDYLPVLPNGHQAATDCSGFIEQPSHVEIARASSQHRPHLVTGSDLLSTSQDGISYGLLSPSGHACFEVWIAMELCDGGTLAQQVSQGFQYCPATRQVDMELLLTLALDIARALSYMHAEHVCHGDLKAENVLLKLLDGQPGSEASANSCWGDSAGECSWLQLLCNNAAGKPIVTRCRRCSNDSCWSFCRSSSSRECTGSSSSGSSTPVSDSQRGRSRSGQLLSLSGLCCVTSSGACIGEDDDDEPCGSGHSDQDNDSTHAVSTGCLACVGFPAVLGNTGAQEPNHSGSSIVSCSTDSTDQAQQLEQQQLHIIPAIGTVLTRDAGRTPPASHEAGNLEDRLSGQPLAGLTPRGPSDDAVEEEHIAPLSLYTTAREHRRSRRLSRTGLMPNVQAALAAAAATGRLSLDSGLAKYVANSRGNSSGSSSAGDANNQSASEDDCEPGDKEGAAAATMMLPQFGQHGQQTEQQQQQRSLLPKFAVLGDGENTPSAMVASAGGSASAADKLAEIPGSFPAGCLSLGRMPPGQAVSARQRRSRSRRHSYCYGLSGASTQLAPSGSLLRQQYTCSHAGISAAEAAAAIAAAAEAVREAVREAVSEHMTAEQGIKHTVPATDPKPAGRRHRPRRMSYDDILLQQPSSPFAVSNRCAFRVGSGEAATGLSGLGRLPAALRRGSGSGHAESRRRRMSWDVRPEMPMTAAVQAMPKAASRAKAGQRTRRHSWTCAYLGDAMDAATSAFSFRGLPSCLQPQEACLGRQGSDPWTHDAVASSQQLLLSRGDGPNTASSSSSSIVAAAGASRQQKENGTESRKRRARRHSWAGFMTEQQSLLYAASTSSKSKACRRLSLCFSPSEVGLDDADSPRRAGFHLPTCVSCCTDGSNYLPLDDSAAQEPLLAYSEHSSTSLSGACNYMDLSDAAMGCLGRLGAKPSSSRCTKGRRRSWCCSSTGSERSLGAGSNLHRIASGDMSARAVAGFGSSHAADSSMATCGRIGRRGSWDVTCPSSLLASAVTASASDPLPDVLQQPSSRPVADSTQQTEATPLIIVEGTSPAVAATSLAADGVTGCVQQAPIVSHADSGTSTAVTAVSVPPAQSGCISRTAVQQTGLSCHAEHHLPAAAATIGQAATIHEGELPVDVLHDPLKHLGRVAAPGLDRDSPEQLFVGSFDCKPSDGSRHSAALSSRGDNGMHVEGHEPSSSTVKMPSAVFAASSPCSASLGAVDTATSNMGNSKERRWSTGVAAHDLLLRQQMLSQQQTGVKVRRASAHIPGEISDIFDAPLPTKQYEAIASGEAASGNQAVNVLGMPTKPAAAINQRRMSYDTATGAYLLVGNQAAAAGAPCMRQSAPVSPDPSQQLPQLLQPTQQQQQSWSEVQAEPVQQLAGPGVQHQQQPQQADGQQHMQRLIEALSKKGYAGLSFDSIDASPLHRQQQERLQTAAQPPAAAAAHQASQLQEQGQQAQAQSVHPTYLRPRFCAKVCDFGFSQCLRAGQSHCSTFNAGTITHQAPEVLRFGRLSPAADVYAFGIILWELLTGERPFRGLLEGDLVYGVCEQGLRPQFPPGAPQLYVELAQQCWAENAAERPTARQLLRRLNEMLYEVRRQRQLEANGSGAHSSMAPGSRPRRHSMPVVGAGRKRRASRRFSLFLPFARQPVSVPEHEPLEQVHPFREAVTYSGTNAAAVGHMHHMTGSNPSSSSKEGACLVPSGSAVHGASSSSNAALSSKRLIRLTSPSATGTAAVANTSGSVAGSVSKIDNGSEWFQSFD